MEPSKVDLQKMFKMGGDQPSFAMDELSSSESKTETAKEREKRSLAYQISPIASRSDRLAPHKENLRPRDKESLLRVKETRRDTKTDIDTGLNRALVQAVWWSRRWPPHVVVVWAAALLLTHALHALAALLAHAVPTLRKFCICLRKWTEDAWLQMDTSRVYAIVLALMTGVSYIVYFVLYALYSVTVWSIEPLNVEVDGGASYDNELTVTDYEDLELKSSDKSKQ